MNKVQLSTPEAPQAIGPYSQGIRIGDLLFLSGQIPLDPKTQTVVTGSIQDQTKRVLENIQAVLKSQGLDMSHIVKSTVFLKDMGEFVNFNEIYGQFFKAPYPARSTVEVARLPKDVKVEIEVIAFAK